jgi:hypothetical protein
MLNVFWDICITDNKNLLIKEGIAEDYQLSNQWAAITIEYADIMSVKARQIVQEDAKFEFLRYKVNYVESVIHLLRSAMRYTTAPDEEAEFQFLCDSLTKFFPSIKLDYKQRERLLPAFDRCQALANKWKIEIQEQAEKINGRTISESKAEYIDFQRMLNSVVKFHELRPTRPTEITVMAFAAYYKEMNDYYETQKVKDGRARQN